jgi:hypothetical protein
LFVVLIPVSYAVEDFWVTEASVWEARKWLGIAVVVKFMPLESMLEINLMEITFLALLKYMSLKLTSGVIQIQPSVALRVIEER